MPSPGQAFDLVHDLTKLSAVASFSVHAAKTHLSRLLVRVAAGEEIIIAKAGRPVARLVAAEGQKTRVLGIDEGKLDVPDDFDAPLPDDLLRAFEGGLTVGARERRPARKRRRPAR